MLPFARVGGTLQCEGVPLDRIAEAVGTPAYVYSSASIRAQYERLDAALAPVPHRIHYACKANSSLGLLALVRSLGGRIDVVSGGELFRARQAGFPAEDIIFGGVGKSAQELREAIDAAVHVISVESEQELRLVDELAREAGAVARVGIRVNPEITVETFHDYIKTGEKGGKFGVPFDEAHAVARIADALPHVRLVALGMHIGSQLTDLAAYRDGIARLEGLIDGVRRDGVTTLEHVDIGGGLFVPYDGESPADLAGYASIVVPAVQRLGLELIVEPGRFLVAESGVLLARVLYRKRSGGRDVLVTDTGMNDLLRPSHYDAYHRIEAVHATTGRGRFDVVGPICESGDFLALDRELASVDAGALLCVFTTGAYGISMASNYNARPRPCEVLVDGSRYGVITVREAYDDLVRRESLTPDWRTSS
ncbi:MAG: diaminopimelate decarboxylase [Gemmatimonadetes bacterium]|nr:diaminopimelate decarboxylase [Gemmatimonadota bacterium]MCC6772832.1 diaminopimelate decarboxylase [Gemmatimonadaceae bacterium]